jgi:hypothetical protein
MAGLGTVVMAEGIVGVDRVGPGTTGPGKAVLDGEAALGTAGVDTVGVGSSTVVGIEEAEQAGLGRAVGGIEVSAQAGVGIVEADTAGVGTAGAGTVEVGTAGLEGSSVLAAHSRDKFVAADRRRDMDQVWFDPAAEQRTRWRNRWAG